MTVEKPANREKHPGIRKEPWLRHHAERVLGWQSTNHRTDAIGKAITNEEIPSLDHSELAIDSAREECSTHG